MRQQLGDFASSLLRQPHQHILEVSIRVMLIEQAALRRADLLAALGELMAFTDGVLVSELLDNRFITMDLSAMCVDLGHQLPSQCTQLFGGHLVEIGPGSHGVDFTKAARLLQLKGSI